ncbi:ALP1-like protein isoform X1 [Tanacetum coccineum]
MVTGVTPSVADGPVLSSSGGYTVEKDMAGHDENVSQTPNTSTANPNKESGWHTPLLLNTWGKYGLAKSMLNSSTGLFLFQFSFMDCLISMLENGSWFIHNNLLILKKWNPDDGLSVISTKLGTPLMLDSYTSDMCMESWGPSSYARAMIELRADVELKDAIVDECPKNTDSGVVKNLKKPSQAPRGVLVGPKVGFKPIKQVYRQVSKKNNVNTSGNNKKNVEVRKDVSNPNPFDVLNSVENDVDFGTNEGTSNLASKEASSSGSSFWNVESSSISTTPIVEKIDKLDKLIINGKITLVDDEGKPLKKVDYPGDHDSEDEVAPVYNEMTSFLASKRVGYAPVLSYVVNGVGYEKGYYLADGIYPQWATFVKSFTVANDAKHVYFKKRQEGARKDVERAFGVLQRRWGIIQQPTRAYHVNTLRRVIYSCIILHNMILKDQKMAVFDWNEVYANPSRNMQRTWIERCETQRRKNKEMRDRDMHLSFQQNLMEHIWQEAEHEDENF